jgi:hypothetical protein
MPDNQSQSLSPQKAALLLLINLALLGALGAAWYYGGLALIWRLDALKLSFLIIAIYLATAFAATFEWISDEALESIESRLPMIALCGTVWGIISVFLLLGEVKFSGAGDFKNLIGPLLAGGGSAMFPTFLALAGSNLLWLHQVVRRWGR